MLPNIIECYRMLLNVTECYRMLQNVTKCYQMLLNVTECYRMLQNVTKCYRMLPNVTEFSPPQNFQCYHSKSYIGLLLGSGGVMVGLSTSLHSGGDYGN